MSRKKILLTALVLGSAVAVATTATSDQPSSGAAVPLDAQDVRPAPTAPQPVEAPVYGPIRAKDPAVRAQIKHLYQQQYDLEAAAAERIAELTDQIRSEPDPDFRWELQRAIGDEKKNLEIQSVQLGLQIAVLNGDEQRAAEFEKALDRMLHPESYAPVLHPDPVRDRERAQDLERAREQGHE